MTEADNLPSISVGEFNYVPEINERTGKRNSKSIIYINWNNSDT